MLYGGSGPAATGTVPVLGNDPVSHCEPRVSIGGVHLRHGKVGRDSATLAADYSRWTTTWASGDCSSMSPPSPRRQARPYLAFGEVLRAARQHAGLSQEALAHKAGVDRTYVGMVERAERVPSLRILWAFADALDLDPAELVRRTQRASEFVRAGGVEA